VDEIKEIAQISSVERILHGIPAEVISKRAVECGSYARALFHWEQFIRQEKEKAAHTNGNFDEEAMYQHLQDIYAQIDEPDSIEGLSTHLHVLDPAQQVLEHRKAGRWLAAQSWYELSLEQAPDDQEVQVNLLTCLKESGQYGSPPFQICTKIVLTDGSITFELCRKLCESLRCRPKQGASICSRSGLGYRQVVKTRERPRRPP
jgi:serine/threonine-protein kinase ATR